MVRQTRIQRTVQALLTLFAGSVIVFLSARLTGNPALTMLPIGATPAQIAQLTRELGLDRPLLQQYEIWGSRLIVGDLGNSTINDTPVWDLIRPRLWYSLQLSGGAVMFSLVLGVPLGVLAATSTRSVVRRAAVAVGAIAQSVPSWWSALLLVLVFGDILRVLPVIGADSWTNYILPIFCLGMVVAAGVLRLTRSAMLEVLDQQFITRARATGISERTVIWKHALRNAILPTVNYIGLIFGNFIGAVTATEVVFVWPGMGTLLYRAILQRDFPVVQGVVMVWLVVVIGLSLCIDLLNVALDPRTRR